MVLMTWPETDVDIFGKCTDSAAWHPGMTRWLQSYHSLHITLPHTIHFNFSVKCKSVSLMQYSDSLFLQCSNHLQKMTSNLISGMLYKCCRYSTVYKTIHIPWWCFSWETWQLWLCQSPHRCLIMKMNQFTTHLSTIQAQVTSDSDLWNLDKEKDMLTHSHSFPTISQFHLSICIYPEDTLCLEHEKMFWWWK